MNKNKVLALALAVCLLATVSMASLAWFTDNDSVTNDFLIAGSENSKPDDVFSVDVWEDATVEDVEGEEKIQDGIVYDAIEPGDVLYKEVHIENTGAYDQYIRATVTVTGASVWQEVYGEVIVPLTEIVKTIDEEALFTVQTFYDVDTDSFVYELYYKDILEPGKDIVVFETVHINPELNREQAAMLQSFQITVVADAVQTMNVGDNVFEAFKTVGLVTNRIPGVRLVSNEEELLLGGTMMLINNIELTGKSTDITLDSTIILNGFCIIADRSYSATSPLNPLEASALNIDGATVSIVGEGCVKNIAEDGAYAIAVINGGNLTIEGGNYSAYYDAIYVDDGELTIAGGFFQAFDDTEGEADYTHSANPDKPTHTAIVINCHKNSYNNYIYGNEGKTAKVTIKGGTLVNEDPSNLREGDFINQNYVPEGYTVVKEVQENGDIWYTVVPVDAAN